MERPRTVHPRFVLTGLCLLALGACRAPGDWAEEADREVYALVSARRASLFGDDSPVRVEPPRDSLRERVLAGTAGPKLELGLLDCLEVAAESQREFQARRERLYLAALDVTLERWLLGWRPQADGDLFLDGAGEEAESVSGAFSPSLQRTLASGADVVLDAGLSLFRFVSTGDSGALSSSFGFSITQPLLRGAGREIVLEDLTQAERDLVYELRAFERFRRTLAFDVALLYFRLLQQLDSVAIERRNRDNLRVLSERNAALAEAGRLSEIQADQARQDVLRSESRLVQIQADYETRLDEFKLFLGLPIDCEIELDRGELERFRQEAEVALELDESEAVAFALEHRLDNLTSRDRVEDARRRARVAADALRLGLDLDVAADASSQEGQPLEYDFSEATWSVGLLFDLPVGKLPERNAYRSALIALQAAQRSAEEFAETIETDVRDELRVIESTLEDYRIQRNAVELAERRVASAELSLQAGRATTRDILEAREALVAAQNASTAALIDYVLARLSLFRDLELLRVDEGGLHTALGEWEAWRAARREGIEP